MGYNTRSGHGYGNQKHGSSGSSFSWRKTKKQKEFVYEEDPKPKVPEETINWSPRPIAQGTQVFLYYKGGKFVISNDLPQQNELGYQISILAENQKLRVEVLTPEGETRKYQIIKIVDQTPEDKPVSFADMAYIGNLKTAMKPNGYTLIGS